MCHHRGICQDKNLTTSTCVPSPRHLPRQTLPLAPECHHRGICQDKNLTTSSCVPSPRHLPRPKPYHKHPRAITAAFAKTKTLPQALVGHHCGICQDNFYHKHPRVITAAFAKTKTLPLAPVCHHRGICQDKNLTASNLCAITAAFAKTKTLPLAPVCHHHGICQDKNLTTSTRVPSPRHWPRQKPYHKHPRAINAAFAKTKTLPQAPVCHHCGICQDKNLTTSTCVPSQRHLPRQKPYR